MEEAEPIPPSFEQPLRLLRANRRQHERLLAQGGAELRSLGATRPKFRSRGRWRGMPVEMEEGRGRKWKEEDKGEEEAEG